MLAMRKRFLKIVGIFIVMFLNSLEAQQKKQTSAAAPKKQAAGKSAVTAKKNSPARKKSVRSRSASSKKHGRTTARRTPRGQQQPTPNRYREIQQALADRGYFKPEPDGVWGPESVEALKQFQQDQNLRPSGRLDPLSLISLGLGPKRDEGAPEKTVEP
jgi:peptidoglycan hydrolase-like protein with peptidoglycan-binding domain